MGKLARPRRRAIPKVAPASAQRDPATRKRRRKGAATRLRSAIRSSFQASTAGRSLRRRIRSTSGRLHALFGQPPLGPVRLGLLCCLVAFIAAGAGYAFRNLASRPATAGTGSAPLDFSSTIPSDADSRPLPRILSRRTAVQLPQTIRAVWVARFHYRDPADIAEIMRNCRAIGADTVLWQVRGEATVAYPSQIEPWSREYGFADPGFDPLAIAVREARENGLRIEAWCNVLPGWKGKKPPMQRDHVYHTHPEWFLHDAKRRRQPLNEDYVLFNPCNPYAREHIVRVFEELMATYALDGLHLDYVRYAWDTEKNARNLYPRDPDTLALFQDQTGKRPDDDPDAWDHWRANQLTRLVSDTREMLDRRRPGAALTAAVRGNLYQGYEDYLQNAVAWLRTGLIDAAYPMAYATKQEDLEKMIGDYRKLAPESRVIPGLGVWRLDTPEQFGRQVEFCLNGGADFALFSYESLFSVAGERGREKVDVKAQRLREMRRDVVRRALTAAP